MTYIKNPPEINGQNFGKIINIYQNINCTFDEFADIVVCRKAEYESIDNIFKQVLGDTGLSIKQIKSLCAAERKTAESEDNEADEITARHILNRVMCELNSGTNTAWTQLTNLKHNIRKTVYGLYSDSLYPIIYTHYTKFMKKQNINNDKNMLSNITPCFAALFEKAWEIIAAKWPECFRAEEENEYNIGNDIGLYSLHNLLNICMLSYNGDIEKGLGQFEKIISESRVTPADWLAAGPFHTVDFNHITGFACHMSSA